MPVPSVTHNQPEYSVSEISTALKRVVEDTFGYVRVRGELSGFTRAASGHLYMDLKDDKAVINGVCWKGNAGKLSFKPEDGLEVICTGKLSTYPGRSNYQLVIESMEPAGLGALMALLEKRKKELAAEGLFDEARKQLLPFMPQTIGVVTSPTGAVIRDILHRIADRFPVHVIVWPVRVQGDGAAEEITAAIRGFNAMDNKPDVLIVARGGGSLEDLWCFNEENVVRAAAESMIPLISAIGHETDTTLIDYASDKRAPTPTAAAEIAVPVRDEWIATIQQWDNRLSQLILQRLRSDKERVEGLARGIPKPSQLLDYASQRLDDWSERLQKSLPHFVQQKEQLLAIIVSSLKPQPVMQIIATHHKQLEQLGNRLPPLINRLLKDKQDALMVQDKLFESMNYKNVLKRGYALVKDGSGALVTSNQTLQSLSSFSVMLHDGTTEAAPVGERSTHTRPKATTRKTKKADQATLF